MIPFSKPSLGREERRAVREVLDSGWLTAGAKNEEFERRFAEYVGVKHAIAVNSGASALFLAIKALGLRGEVILPSFTFAASANAVETAGATPVFADIDPKTFNLDPRSVEERITARTEAIMPVHVAGLSCDMTAIMRLASKRGLAVIEDSAQAIGAEHRGRRTGSFGTGCFSFFPTKNITTGEGGMVTTNDGRLAETIRTLKGHGFARGAGRTAALPGFNFRMSDIAAAIGGEQLKKIDELNDLRIAHAGHLARKLPADVTAPRPEGGEKHVFQMFVTTVDPRLRNGLRDHLSSKNIGLAVFADPPVHRHPHYLRKYGKRSAGALPATEWAARSNLALPMFPQLKRKQLDRTISAVSDFFYRHAE
jgi:dTDP-4-amino-4,6-dideoxygalactose transaminase